MTLTDHLCDGMFSPHASLPATTNRRLDQSQLELLQWLERRLSAWIRPGSPAEIYVLDRDRAGDAPEYIAHRLREIKALRWDLTPTTALTTTTGDHAR